MKTTTNLGLKKPEGTDIVNIDDINYNADIMDAEIGNIKKGVVKVGASGSSDAAAKLQTPRAISLNGDVIGNANFDGSANTCINARLQNSGVTTGSYTKVSVDEKGRVVAGSNPMTLAGYGITDALPASAYTATDVLNKLKTVHGESSGLNADLLDGKDSTAFATAAQGAKADTALQTSQLDKPGGVTSYDVFKSNLEDLVQLSNPNLLINGDFQVWQRGTSFTLKDTLNYTADRWQCMSQSSTTIVEKVPNGLKMTRNNSVSGVSRLTYPMEDRDFHKIKGKTVTLSFDIEMSYTALPLYIHLKGNTGFMMFGTRDFDIVSGNRYEYTFKVPNDIDRLNFFVQTANDGYLILRNVKLELGNKATPFTPRSYAQELALCQRYYLHLNSQEWSTLHRIYGGDNRVDVFLPSTMRIEPTLKYNAVPQIFTDSAVWANGDTVYTANFYLNKISLVVPCSALTTQKSYLVRYLPDLDSEIY